MEGVSCCKFGFAFGELRKAFNLLNAKRLTLAAQSGTGDLKSRALIPNGC
jgi:hypothetical protein